MTSINMLGVAIVGKISDGSVDDMLNDIVQAIIARRATLAAKANAQLLVGMRVRVNSIARDKYQGLQGVITDKRGKWISVTHDSGLRMRYSATLLDVLS